MTTKKRRDPGEIERKHQIKARLRADEQARRIRWSQLLEVRTDYVSWTEFYFWTRSIMEAEASIPDWLKKILEQKCPGFFEYEDLFCQEHPKQMSLPWQRLSEWIDEHIFRFAHQEGWLEAITFYALRDPRAQRAMAYWKECRAQWRKRRPRSLPLFEEWRDAADQCDYSSLLCPEVRAAMEPSNGIAAERFAAAVARYIDWEAFVYWCRPALDAEGDLPPEVDRELQVRCPGFLEWDKQMRKRDLRRKPRTWNRLITWGEEQFFDAAKREGWFDAVFLQASYHPRRLRTIEYWAHWDSAWSLEHGLCYPSFEEWRKAADDYVDESPT